MLIILQSFVTLLSTNPLNITHTLKHIMKTFILQNYAGEKIGEVKRKNWNEVEYAVNHLNSELRKHYDLGIIDRSFLDKNVIGFIKGQKSTLAL